MKHRYRVEYAAKGYCVRDAALNLTISQFVSKSAAIARAQQLNRFSPIDGEEQTYAQQIMDERPKTRTEEANSLLEDFIGGRLGPRSTERLLKLIFILAADVDALEEQLKRRKQ